jgi:thioredoxin-related protein
MNNTSMEGTPMPTFNLLKTDSKTIVSTNYGSNNKAIVFILISPSCPHCNAVIKDVTKHISTLSKIQFFIISPFPMEEIKALDKQYQLNKYKNVTIARDSEFFFQNYFKVKGVPFIAVYNNMKKLKKVLVGEVPSEEIKRIALD